MTGELTNLINTLNRYDSGTRPKCLNFILNFKQFIEALVKIDSLIGLKEAKYKVYLQVRSFIVNYRRHGVPINSEKSNILLCGSSGCGKSRLGYYLAQLLAVSGCIKTNNGKDIFEFPKEQTLVQPPNLNNIIVPGGPNGPSTTIGPIVKQFDEEKHQLKQSLAIRESQILNFRTRTQKIDMILNDMLTSFNNVRKKITSKDPKEEKLVQNKLQIIKSTIKDLRSSQSGTPLLQQILPVTIPLIPGRPNTFEVNHLPFSPSVNLFDLKIPTSPISHVNSNINNNFILPMPGMPNMSNIPPIPTIPAVPVVPTVPTIPASSIVEKDKNVEVKFIVVTKGDLVGKYQGHTEDRVRKLLNKYIGGVIMIDESYSLMTSSSDDYGSVVTTEIINFMSTHPGKIIFIFAGYREAMQNIFRLQEGLSRRIEFVVDIEEYTSDELVDIFIQQVSEFEITIDDSLKLLLRNFFKNKKDKFPQFGGSTEKFAKCLKQIIYSDEDKFTDALNDEITDADFEKKFLSIDMKVVEKAYKLYLDNSVETVYNKMNDKSFENMRSIYN